MVLGMGNVESMKMSSPFQANPEKVSYDDEIAQFVEDEYDRRRRAKLPFELQWRLNMEFLNGNQFMDIDTTAMNLQEIPKMYWYQEREVFNQLATIYETRVAQLARTIPILKVRPASQDDGDIGAAVVSSSLLMSTWYGEDMDVVWDDLCAWTEATGTGIIKTIWDKDKGKLVTQHQVPIEKPHEPNQSEGDTQQVMEMLGNQEEMETVDIKEGDLDAVAISPFEFFPDNNYVSSLEKCRSVIHARAFDVREIEERWGVQVTPEKVDVMSMQAMNSGTGGMGYGAGGFKNAAAQIEKHAIVKEYYERESKQYPNGRFIIVANKQVLHVGELPYMVGEDDKRDFPFVMSRSIKKPGQLFGVSIVERLIPIQRRYNALRNRKAEYLNRVVIGQWYEPEGSLGDDSELNDEPGNIIRYRAATGKPEPVEFPNLPASFENEIQILLNEFTAISGVSELSRYSQAPSGVKSGVALSIANEQDNTRISNTASNLAQCIKLMGKQWLRLYRQFAQEPRVLRLAGKEQDVEVVHWHASMLKSDDVIIENSSALAETPSQRRQMVFDMMSSGLFVKEEQSTISEGARRKIFEMLEYGNWEGSMMEISRLQEKKAKRENMKIKVGEIVPSNDYDDDELHIEMHNRMRMSAEYEELLTGDQGEEVENAMATHIQMHQQSIAEREAAAMQQQLDQQMQQQAIAQQGKNEAL
jgi:hypothetical protein